MAQTSPGWELHWWGLWGPWWGVGPLSERARWVELENQRLAQGPISCDILAPWAWQGMVLPPSALARDMPKAQLLVPSWAQFGKVLECWWVALPQAASESLPGPCCWAHCPQCPATRGKLQGVTPVAQGAQG